MEVQKSIFKIMECSFHVFSVALKINENDITVYQKNANLNVLLQKDEDKLHLYLILKNVYEQSALNYGNRT